MAQLENDTYLKLIQFCHSMRFMPNGQPFREEDYIEDFRRICKLEHQRKLFQMIITRSMTLEEVAKIRAQLRLKDEYKVTEAVINVKQQIRKTKDEIAENEKKLEYLKESLKKKGLTLVENKKLRYELRTKTLLLNCKKQEVLLDIEACENLNQPVQNSSFSSMNCSHQITSSSIDVSRDCSMSLVKTELSEEEIKMAILDCIKKLRAFRRLPPSEAEYEEKSLDDYVMNRLQRGMDVMKVYNCFLQLQEDALRDSLDTFTKFRKLIEANDANAKKKLLQLQAEYLDFEDMKMNLRKKLQHTNMDVASLKKRAVETLHDECSKQFIKAPVLEDIVRFVDVLLHYKQLLMKEERMRTPYPDPESAYRESQQKILTNPVLVYKQLDTSAKVNQLEVSAILRNTSFICSQLRDMQIDIIKGLDGCHPENVESDVMVSVLEDLEGFVQQEVTEFESFPLNCLDGISFPSSQQTVNPRFLCPVTLTMNIPSSISKKKALNFIEVSPNNVLGRVLQLVGLKEYSDLLSRNHFSSSSFSEDLDSSEEDEDSTCLEILSDITSLLNTSSEIASDYQAIRNKVQFWMEQPLRHAVLNNMVMHGRTFEAFKNLAERHMFYLRK